MLTFAIAAATCGALVGAPAPLPSYHATRRTQQICHMQMQDERIMAEMQDDRKVDALFAWISRAFAGDPKYNNLMLAFAAIYGGDERLQPLVDRAMENLPAEDEAVGEPISLLSLIHI